MFSYFSKLSSISRGLDFLQGLFQILFKFGIYLEGEMYSNITLSVFSLS